MVLYQPGSSMTKLHQEEGRKTYGTYPTESLILNTMMMVKIRNMLSECIRLFLFLQVMSLFVDHIC